MSALGVEHTDKQKRHAIKDANLVTLAQFNTQTGAARAVIEQLVAMMRPDRRRIHLETNTNANEQQNRQTNAYKTLCLRSMHPNRIEHRTRQGRWICRVSCLDVRAERDGERAALRDVERRRPACARELPVSVSA
jgi:hypothetical protein